MSLVLTLHAAAEHFYFPALLIEARQRHPICQETTGCFCFTAVDTEMAVADKLTCLGARFSKAHDIEDIIQLLFPQLQTILRKFCPPLSMLTWNVVAPVYGTCVAQTTITFQKISCFPVDIIGTQHPCILPRLF